MDGRKPLRLPHIGLRNLKTALSASLCAFFYYFIDRNPTFACIGAVFGMGTDIEHSKLHGGNRLFGTIIGGFLGIALFWVYLLFYPDGNTRLALVPLLFVGIVILILLSQKFWVGAVQPGGVVLCIVLFNTPVDSYVPYALNRMFDTAIGVAMSLLINHLFPRERLVVWRSWLYEQLARLKR
ncbi:FUSC family protein [Flavonifractor sp. An92]|uniref:FUSC family protein n=1 Tax=Flavonifractor sp. An92 TaxID=1965666 RepID=UPI000B380340|nr:FUSC family protein [Flavonifractor sp. An92]OUN04655.1 FUSC family protein [Flavonifractor sp. An92]